MPYFAGPKNVLCTASIRKAAIVTHRFCIHSPTIASSAMGTSAIFAVTATRCLLIRSATHPEKPESRIKGTVSISATHPCPPSPSCPAQIPLTTMKIRTCFRTLSLAAPKNCVTRRAIRPRLTRPLRTSTRLSGEPPGSGPRFPYASSPSSGAAPSSDGETA